MKQTVAVIMFFVFYAALPANPAHSQDEIMLLSSEAFDARRRVPVIFAHEQHSEKIECTRCHHDYDEFGANAGGDEQPCASCHTLLAGDNPIALMNAFHLQCKGCHEKLASAGQYSPPRTCGGCHARAMVSAAHVIVPEKK